MVGFNTDRTRMKTILYHITKTWIEEDIVFKRNLVSLPFSSHLTALQPQSRTQTTKHQIQFVWIDPTHLNMCWNDTTVQSNSIIFDLSSLFLFSFVMPSVFGCTSYFIGGGFQTLKRKVAVQLLLLLLGQLLVILQLAAMAGNNSKIFPPPLLS